MTSIFTYRSHGENYAIVSRCFLDDSCNFLQGSVSIEGIGKDFSVVIASGSICDERLIASAVLSALLTAISFIEIPKWSRTKLKIK